MEPVLEGFSARLLSTDPASSDAFSFTASRGGLCDREFIRQARVEMNTKLSVAIDRLFPRPPLALKRPSESAEPDKD